MEGNQCRKLLDLALKLEDVLPKELQLFALALHRLKFVVTGCFSKDLARDYEQRIIDFKVVGHDLQLPLTQKLHIIFDHVPQSKQASKCVHKDFGGVYPELQECHPSVVQILHRVVVAYSMLHL